MVTLNLVNPEKSQIDYKISRFPDGQQTIDLTDWSVIERHGDVIQINTRLSSFKDVELLICATQALRNLTDRPITLYAPYFLGSRSDRRFQKGGVNYLKQVICPIINSLNFAEVAVLDPHSDVLEACLNNYMKVSNHIMVKHALKDINVDKSQICLVSPDAGAYKKIFDVAKEFGIEKIITANKVRDMKTGDILRTEIPTLDQHNDITYVIIDDICDGGRTFVELVNAIKWGRPSAKSYLIVTHGIFSTGYAKLEECFESIYTTNSYKEIEGAPDKVKQFNVF